MMVMVVMAVVVVVVAEEEEYMNFKVENYNLINKMDKLYTSSNLHLKIIVINILSISSR